MSNQTVGRLLQVKQGQGTPPTLEVGEFGFKTNTNQEELFIGSNSGNIKVMTENDDVSVPLATTSNDGLLSKEDKVKINSIATGANNTTIVNNLTSTSTTSALSAYQGKLLKDMIDTGGGSGGGSGGGGLSGYQNGVTRSSTGNAFGYQTNASGGHSLASGVSASAKGDYSTSFGANSHAENTASFAVGATPKMTAVHTTNFVSTADAFVIGNGGVFLTSTPSNAFRVTFDGKVYGRSAYNSSGADYAEYFEWEDGNLDNEDRVGYFVTLDGENIRKANSTDTYILGIISANPSVVGDSSSEGWIGEYVKDDFGRIQYQWVEYEEKRDDGEIEIPKEYKPIRNKDYNPNKKYIPREDRKEWSPVGMMGKLLVRDDGTCEINGYCSPNDDGIATKSDDGYRVMKRVSDNIIQVLVK